MVQNFIIQLKIKIKYLLIKLIQIIFVKNINVTFHEQVSTLKIMVTKKKTLITTKIIGEFNIENLVMVYAFLKNCIYAKQYKKSF